MTFDFKLTGKTAIVTGASSGMGERFAQVLAGQGVNVVCAARRADRLSRLVAEIREQGGRAEAVACDVTDTGQLDQLFSAARHAFGTVEILINNAGSPGELKPFYQIESADWQQLIGLNLDAVFETSKLFARQLIAAGKPGAIVNISSIASIQAPPLAAPYAASKAGVTQLTKVIALDLADHGIRANSIAPGVFHTEIYSDELLNSEVGRHVISQIPLQRCGQVEDLDGLILLLTSNASSFITGAEFVIDGGTAVKMPGY